MVDSEIGLGGSDRQKMIDFNTWEATMRFYGSADGRKLTIRDQSENGFKINRRDEKLRIKRRLIYTCVGKMDFFRK